MLATISGGAEEVLEIRRRVDEHLARAVQPVEVVTLTGLRHPRPALEVGELALGALREQVVGEARRSSPRRARSSMTP